MNKKSLFGLFAMGTLLFTASCQEEQVVQQQPQEPTAATVSVGVTTPELGVNTRVFGDGKTAQTLHYAVYNAKVDAVGDTVLTYLPDLTVENHEFELSTTVDLQLVTGNTYKVIFWADSDDAPYTINWTDTVDGKPTASVSVDYTNVTSNNEAYDAFFNWMTIEVNGSKTESIKLYRPFGQLNIGTNDSIKAAQAGYAVKETQVTVATYNTLDLWTKEVSGDTTVTFAWATIPYSTKETFPVKVATGELPYYYLAMNYLLLPTDKKLVDVTFDYTDSLDNKQRTFSAVPVRRNWRTNIYGQLLTSDIDVNVEIVPLFVDEAVHPDSVYNREVWDGKTLTKPARNGDEVLVYHGDELAYIANMINGGGQSNAAHAPATRGEVDDYNYAQKKTVIKLMDNIDLGGENWTPINGFEGTFDGWDEERQDNFVISNLKVSTEGRASAGLFGSSKGTIKNLTVKDAEVYGHYKAGVIAGDGLCGKFENCHVENAVVVSTPYNNDDANNVGGIVGYLSAEPTAYVKNCSVKNAEITAYRKVGGIVGAATGSGGKAEISGNTVENVTVTADQSAEYSEDKPFDAGEIVGWANPDATVVENNTVGANVNLKYIYFGGAVNNNGIYEVENREQLSNILGLELNGDITIAFIGDIEGNVVVEQQEGLNYIIDGRQHKYDGTIELYGHARHTGKETLVLRNINFEHTDGAIDFISCNTTESAKRYAHNVTVENCTFTGNSNGDVVGMRYRQCYDISVINSTATNMHSLMWATGVTGLTFDGVQVSNSKSGVSVGTSTNVVIANSNIAVDEDYAVRADGVTTKLVVKNSELSGNVPVIVRKLTAAHTYDVLLEGDVKLNTLGKYHVVFTNGADDAEYVTPEGKYSIVGAESYAVYPRDGIVDAADDLIEALERGANVVFTGDVNIDPANMSNAYGKTGINVTNGQTVDGGGYTLDIKGAGGTWDSGINTTGGLIKNLTVTGSYRGIFINHNSTHSEKVVLENVTIDGTTYTISCDQGMNQGLEATNSTFKGWTSYAATLGKAKFTDCYFGEGNGYSYCRPYAPTEFVGCEFEAGFELDARATVSFENCTLGGVALTAENLATLVTSNISNATVK